jgi:hypothetical protein
VEEPAFSAACDSNIAIIASELHGYRFAVGGGGFEELASAGS